MSHGFRAVRRLKFQIDSIEMVSFAGIKSD